MKKRQLLTPEQRSESAKRGVKTRNENKNKTAGRQIDPTTANPDPRRNQTTKRTPSPSTLPTAPALGTGTAGNDAHAAPTQPAQPPGIDPDVLRPFVGLPFDVWARVSGCDDVSLTPEESNGIALALARVINKYAPSGTMKFGEEIGLALVLGPILLTKLSRVAKAKQIETEKTIDEQPATSSNNGQINMSPGIGTPTGFAAGPPAG